MGASKMQQAELQKPFEWTWNIRDYFQSQILHDLWPFDPKINKAQSWLLGLKCMKFYK